MSDPKSVREHCEQIHSHFGPVDVLVNNAGMTADDQFARMQMQDWQRVLDVNLHGVFHVTKRLYEVLCQSARGRLISISSVVGQMGNFGQANYAAANTALFGFTRTLTKEMARFESTAYCVAPGFTQISMLQDVPEEILETIKDSIPPGRFARPVEIAGVVRFLVRERASYITGQVIGVNGGMF